MEINIVNMKNEPVDKVEIPEMVADAQPNRSLVYELVRQYQAGGRQGTAATKTRGLVSGSGRKLWKQKGTGRARIGSVRSPLWRHGGTVFGPQPRDYSYRIPSKKRILAICSILSQKMKDGGVFVVDEIRVESGKTKDAAEWMKSFQLKEETLIVDQVRNENLQRSVRNLPGVKFSTVAAFNVVDALKFKNLIISKQAFQQLARMLTK